MRVFSGALGTETNTFGPMPTGLASFKERFYYPAGQHPEKLTGYSGPLLAARLQSKSKGWTLIEGMVAGAVPGGKTTRLAYETLRDELLGDLKAAMPVDMVVLGLHGAMVAEGYDDCEGDLLMRARAIVGRSVVIGVEFDPHSHLSTKMVSNADILIAMKEYPHTDVMERAHEVVSICADTVAGNIKPTAAVIDCHMVVPLHTSRQPARGFIDRIQTMEGQDGVLSISVLQGFPWGDVAEMGTKILVYTNNNPQLAETLARQLANELISMREQLAPIYPTIDEALDEALAFKDGTVVLADGADNAGAGAASDSTFILRRMIERGVNDAALGPLWDPVAVRTAFEAGEGAHLPIRIGGKIGPMSGDPVDLDCVVKKLSIDLRMTGLANASISMGDCALLHAGGIEIVVTTKRNQAIGTDLFTQLRCNLANKKIIVVKSMQHFYASFVEVAAKVIYVGAPGTSTSDLSTLNFENIRRPKWPLDDFV